MPRSLLSDRFRQTYTTYDNKVYKQVYFPNTSLRYFCILLDPGTINDGPSFRPKEKIINGAKA